MIVVLCAIIGYITTAFVMNYITNVIKGFVKEKNKHSDKYIYPPWGNDESFRIVVLVVFWPFGVIIAPLWLIVKLLDHLSVLENHGIDLGMRLGGKKEVKERKTIPRPNPPTNYREAPRCESCGQIFVE